MTNRDASMSDSIYNFAYQADKLYVQGKDISIDGNGVCNRSIVEAYLPPFYQGIRIYGTGYKCLSRLSNLKYVFIPRTYRVIGGDFCHSSSNVETIEFEENSQVSTISGWFAFATSISKIYIPSSVKVLSNAETFRSCIKLKKIFYGGMMKIENNNLFLSGVPSDLEVYVRVDYKYSDFGGRSIKKILANPMLKCTLKHNASHFGLNELACIVILAI